MGRCPEMRETVTGNRESDNGETGSGETVCGETCSGGTGCGETGKGETGSGETGSGETGSEKTGKGETGSGEIGNGETGKGETGSGETGKKGDFKTGQHRAVLLARLRRAGELCNLATFVHSSFAFMMAVSLSIHGRRRTSRGMNLAALKPRRTRCMHYCMEL